MGFSLGKALGFAFNPTGAIGTVASMAGDLYGAQVDKDINKANIAAQERANEQNRQHALEVERRNAELQREFAQHGISWKVEDAKKAGLHPLSALGTNATPYSPTVAMNFAEAPKSAPLGHHFANMGQNLAAAIRSLTAEERLKRHLELEGMRAMNDKTFAEASYWASQAAHARQMALSDSTLTGGHEFDAIEHKASQPVSAASADPSREAGTHPFWVRYQLADGGYIDLPSQEAAEALENIHVTGLPIMLRKARQYFKEDLPREVQQIRRYYSQQ